MSTLLIHEAHQHLGARFCQIDGEEAVACYGDVGAEYARLRATAAVLDLSFRTRLVLIGADRASFLHSQCTNDIVGLSPGTGCYAAFTSNKGRLQGDASVFLLPDEILLDAEPGQSRSLTDRFARFIVSEDVEVVDAAPHYGLLSLQGPGSGRAIEQLGLCAAPERPYASVRVEHPVMGEIHLANHPRLRTAGVDLFVPAASLAAVFDMLLTAVAPLGGGPAGWEAFELARIEAGIPRFGVDMDEGNLAPEAGIGERAISYRKGCYLGQEVLNRLRTFAEVNKRLCRLRFAAGLGGLPGPGAKLLRDHREVGKVTSAARLPDGTGVGLGYLRKEWPEPGERFTTDDGFQVESLGPLS